MDKTCYLIGPITGLNYNDCTDWREYAKKRLKKYGIKGIDPMRGKHYLANETSVKDQYTEEVLACQKGITARDRFDTKSASVCLANFLGAEKVSVGSCIEFGWADAFRNPVVMVLEKEGNPHDHSMMREIAGFILHDLDEAINVVIAILGDHDD